MTLASAFDLTGKAALVTGSTMGIGLGVARVLAQAGAHVVISSRKQDDCARIASALVAEGFSAEGRACHIGRMEDIAAMENHLRDTHGGLDILVNNAVLSPWRSIEDTDPGIFAKAMDVNMRGVWYLTVAATRLMKQRGGGSLIHISSVAGLHPDHNLALYSTLKTAMLGMSRAFALEYGRHKIRSNCILPGVIETKLARAFEGEAQAAILKSTPLGRIGQPEEIGYAALYLASAASAFMTGGQIVIDGGLSVGST
jgi:NAD(P)-dependent dehydrogenase (short-subunit alcohol dehydrogenase family)